MITKLPKSKNAQEVSEQRRIFRTSNWSIGSQTAANQAWAELLKNYPLINWCFEIEVNGHFNNLTNNEEFIKCLTLPVFTSLKCLRLNFLILKNIENLVNIECPNLEELNLQDNKIISLKPMIKMINVKITFLELTHNQFTTLKLSRANFSDSHYFELGIAEYTYKNSSTINNVYDFRQIMKIKGNFMDKIQIKTLINIWNVYPKRKAMKSQNCKVQLSEKYCSVIEKRFMKNE